MRIADSDRLTPCRDWGSILWPLAFLVTAAVAACPALLIEPPWWDTCCYRWNGRRLLAGDMLYRDMWDVKFPPLHWIDELAAATGHQVIALYVLQVLTIAVGGWLLYRLVGMCFSRGCGGLTGLSYITLASSPTTIDWGNLPEHWAAPCVILGLYVMARLASAGAGRRRDLTWPAVSGLALGAAACLRPPAMLIAAALVPFLPMLRRTRRLTAGALLVWAAGVLAVPALAVLWAAAHGVLGAMGVRFQFLVFDYSSDNPEWATWGHAVEAAGKMVWQNWPWYALAAQGVVLMLFHRAAGDDRRSPHSQPIPLAPVALVWLIAAVVSALPGLRAYPHYFYLAVAPLALLTAWAWQALLSAGRGAPVLVRAVAIGAVLAAAAAFVGYRCVDDFQTASLHRKSAAAVAEAKDFLSAHGRPDQTIFIFSWGRATRLYSDLGWRCSSRHATARVYAEAECFSGPLQEWLRDMLDHPPDWLVGSGDEDLLLGDLAKVSGWGRPAPQAAVAKIRQAYRPQYVEAARFASGDPAGRDTMSIVIYKKK